jgi:hypothetical protein
MASLLHLLQLANALSQRHDLVLRVHVFGYLGAKELKRGTTG